MCNVLNSFKPVKNIIELICVMLILLGSKVIGCYGDERFLFYWNQ